MRGKEQSKTESNHTLVERNGKWIRGRTQQTFTRWWEREETLATKVETLEEWNEKVMLRRLTTALLAQASERGGGGEGKERRRGRVSETRAQTTAHWEWEEDECGEEGESAEYDWGWDGWGWGGECGGQHSAQIFRSSLVGLCVRAALRAPTWLVCALVLPISTCFAGSFSPKGCLTYRQSIAGTHTHTLMQTVTPVRVKYSGECSRGYTDTRST